MSTKMYMFLMRKNLYFVCRNMLEKTAAALSGQKARDDFQRRGKRFILLYKILLYRCPTKVNNLLVEYSGNPIQRTPL